MGEQSFGLHEKKKLGILVQTVKRQDKIKSIFVQYYEIFIAFKLSSSFGSNGFDAHFFFIVVPNFSTIKSKTLFFLF